MNKPTPKRTKMTAVYLTATERDLVTHAISLLYSELQGVTSNSIVRFGTSYTGRRIMEVLALFEDKEKS